MIDKYKNAEWVTIGKGPIRLQVVNANNLNMGLMYFLSLKLFEIQHEAGLHKDFMGE